MTATVAERVWNEQSVWSQAANRLRDELARKRLRALMFTVAGGVLSAAAVTFGMDCTTGRVLAFASAVAVGIGAIVAAGIGREAVQNWTRARSVSEAIKSEVFRYLAGIGEYALDGRDATLDARVAAIEEDGDDMARFKLGISAEQRPLPAVSDVDSYLNLRITKQIDDYYLPRAVALERKLALVRRAEGGLGMAGVVLAAGAAALGSDAVGIWVPVVTTVGAAITAHAAAARYEYLLVEYLRTAQELERLRDRRGSAATLTPEQIVSKAEHVISVQNEGWMAKLTSRDEPRAGG